jgi:hypothetical protein
VFFPIMATKQHRAPTFFGVMIYAAGFFLTYKVLFQFSYEEGLFWFANLAYGLIVIHIIGFFWSLVECLASLKLRLMGSIVCTIPFVIGLQFLVQPDPIKLNLWMHKRAYLARVAASPRSPDGRVSIVVFDHASYIPSMPGGYRCTVQIVYDNSNDVRLIAETEDGRADVVPVGDSFYLRYPPCG